MGVGSSIDNPFRWETFWPEQYKYITAFSVIWKVDEKSQTYLGATSLQVEKQGQEENL